MPETPPPRLNMAAYCLAEGARRTPDKAALLVLRALQAGPSETWTYRELQDAVLRVAGGLQANGLRPGGRVLIRLDNTSAYAILFFGAVAGGFVPIPASSELTDAEAGFMLGDSGAAAVALADSVEGMDLPAGLLVLTAADVAGLIQSGPQASYAGTQANDAAFMVYTSGTTARPKGVLHAHRSAFGRRPMYQGWYGIGATDRVLHAGAFNWTFTLGTGLTDPWANGATAIVFTGEKGPEVWPQLIRETQATIFAAVPGVYRQILKYAPPGPLDLGALRHGLTAGEAPPGNLFGDWQARTGTALYEALGMSEISTYISSSPSVPRKPGTTGKPQSGRQIAVLPVAEGDDEPLPRGEQGLLAVHRSDPGLMLGYWNRPAEEADVMRGDWFCGGDLAVIDADGYVTHLGRANEIMKALGYRVSPLEVEAALGAHPDIGEIACAELTVRAGVSVIAAFVVPRPGREIEPDAVKAFAATRLAAYKCPREVVIVDALPRTPNGKVQRSRLAALAAASQ
jgi:acetyl-CoA synthetase